MTTKATTTKARTRKATAKKRPPTVKNPNDHSLDVKPATLKRYRAIAAFAATLEAPNQGALAAAVAANWPKDDPDLGIPMTKHRVHRILRAAGFRPKRKVAA